MFPIIVPGVVEISEADVWVIGLALVMMLFDIISGFIQAAINGELDSTKMRQGLCHKALLILLICMAFVIQTATTHIGDTGWGFPIVLPCCIYIVVMSVRTALVFIGSFKGLEDSQERRSSAQQYFHTICGVLRILMLFVAAVVVVAILLDKNPMTLFAGLGATSAVLMLVFKDTISGLVAGVRLTSNDMLHKGDWITVKSVDANGIVEDISLTTVKVRNFDNTIVTISPINLVNGSFQNWIGMQKSGGRRVKRVVYFDFRSVRLVDEALKRNLLAKHFATEDSFKLKESLQKAIDKDIQEGKDIEDLKNPAALAPTNLQLYRKFMEKYLRQRPEVNTDLTLMVRHMEATQCGLPIEFYFFIKDKVWVNYEHILADIMEHAYALANEFGLKIYEQYPEQ